MSSIMPYVKAAVKKLTLSNGLASHYLERTIWTTVEILYRIEPARPVNVFQDKN